MLMRPSVIQDITRATTAQPAIPTTIGRAVPSTNSPDHRHDHRAGQ
jgi:hypothetical protein